MTTPIEGARYDMLFLCTGNSARSVLAEAIVNRHHADRFRAHSAGSHPKGTVHPMALHLLERRGFSTDGLRSKPWEEFAEGPRGSACARLRVHRLRRRGRGDLPHLARASDERALGRAGPGRRPRD